MCDDLNLLRVISLLKNILDLLFIIIPIGLIILASIDLAKIVVSNEDIEKQSIAKLTKRMIAAVFVFFVPTMVFMLINTVESNNNNFFTCWNNANSDYIAKLEYIQRIEQEVQKEEIKKEESNNSNGNNSSNDDLDVEDPTIDDSDPNRPPILDIRSTKYTPFVNGVQRALKEGDCMNKEDNCFCPTVGKYTGFQFTVGDEKTRTFNWYELTDKMVMVKVTCSDGSVISKKVNEKTKSNFEKAFQKVCELKTTGVNGVKVDPNYVQLNGTLVVRTNSARTVCSNHSYGSAIDINYKLSITVNGKSYKPYSGQGKATKKEYDEFVKALGKKSDPRNVNYILWIYAFKPAGFTWGGNWSDSYFDPMHYEVK